MSDLVPVCRIKELPPNKREIVFVESEPIAVINYQGDYYAIQNTCLHQHGPVSEGRVKGRLTAEWSEPGERVKEYFDENEPAIACPLHGWEYDLKTGEHLADCNYTLTTYDIILKGDMIYLEK